MNDLSMRYYGDPILKKKSVEVEAVDEDVRTLISKMSRIMRQYEGVGLAAPQLGILKRIIVYKIDNELVGLVNPRIIWRQGKEVMPEGCLSLPGVNIDVKRSQEIIVEGLDKRGKPVQLGELGVKARVIQHEIDHLDGVLIIDRVHKKKLKPVRKQLREIKEHGLLC